MDEKQIERVMMLPPGKLRGDLLTRSITDHNPMKAVYNWLFSYNTEDTLNDAIESDWSRLALQVF